jgi:hypothetical protein
MSLTVILVAVAVIALGAIVYYNRKSKSFDVNQDGKIDVKDAVEAAQRAAAGAKVDVKAALDVNKDGKLDAADATVVANKAKKAAGKVKTAVKKTTTKKK